MSTQYGAPWSRLLRVMSIGASALLIGISFLTARAVGGAFSPLGLAAVCAPLALLFATMLFCVRGYEIAGGELHVRRLLWTTRLSLDGLRAVEADPGALRGSIRLAGNGGLFAFTGLFRNKRLGRYRAFLTDHRLAVILSWDDRRVVISPDRPEVFVDSLRRLRRLAS